MIKGSDCAFPIVVDNVSQNQFCEGGLTKREYFAILILQGLHAARPGGFQEIDFQWFPEQAVKFADALIERLGKNHDAE